MEVSDHAQFHARCHFNDIRRLTMLNLAAGMTSVTGTGSVRTYEANIKDAWCLLVTPLKHLKKPSPEVFARHHFLPLPAPSILRKSRYFIVGYTISVSFACRQFRFP